MRSYLILKKAELDFFANNHALTVSSLFAPTVALAQKYGVIAIEECEYAAMESAWEFAERSRESLILALEIAPERLALLVENSPGELQGELILNWEEVIAFYLSDSADKELKWFDLSELDLLFDEKSI